jgi:hypothetical protein
MKDMAHRNTFLAPCIHAETGPAPTNVWMDTIVEAVPKVSPFLFFESSDLFSIDVLMRLVTIAVAKMVFGDVIGVSVSWLWDRLCLRTN